MYSGLLTVMVNGWICFSWMLFYWGPHCEKGKCLTAFDCLLMRIAEKLPDLRLNNWVSGYRNAKLLLLVKSSPSYTSAAWISPQGMWEMYLTFEKQAVWNNFTLCRGSAMSLSRVGQKWLELNIYSRASQADIKVSGNILLRDTFPLLSSVDPGVTFGELCLSAPSGIGCDELDAGRGCI